MKAEQDYSGWKALHRMGVGWGIRARARSKRGPAGRSLSLYLLQSLLWWWMVFWPTIWGLPPSGSHAATLICSHFLVPLLGSQLPVPLQLHLIDEQREMFRMPSSSPFPIPSNLSCMSSPCSLQNLLSLLPISSYQWIWAFVKAKLCACAFPMTKIPEVDFQYVQVILANWGEGKNQGEKICKYFSKLNFHNFCQWL